MFYCKYQSFLTCFECAGRSRCGAPKRLPRQSNDKTALVVALGLVNKLQFLRYGTPVTTIKIQHGIARHLALTS